MIRPFLENIPSIAFPPTNNSKREGSKKGNRKACFDSWTYRFNWLKSPNANAPNNQPFFLCFGNIYPYTIYVKWNFLIHL